MPTGNPLVGEVWEMTDPTGRTIRGIVADVSPTILVLVSFTGNRFRIAPSRMLATWRFSQAPPNTALRCSRRGCPHAGILRIVSGSTTDWVCPRHLPVGVQATLTTESIGTAQAPLPETPGVIDVQFEVWCSNCQNPDPVEDHRIQLPPSTTMWICPRCNERWCTVHASRVWLTGQNIGILSNLLDGIRVALTLENYRIEDITTPHSSTFRCFEGNTLSNHTETVFEGIPIRWDPMPTSDTLLRLRLRGGPEYRPPERQLGMTSNFQMVYGRGPGGVMTGTPIPRDVPMVAPSHGRIDLSPITFERTYLAPNPDASELLDAMAPTPFVSKGTRWVNRGTGEVIEVDHTGLSIDHVPVVHFKRISDSLEANVVLLQRDFETMFRPFTQENPKKAREAVVEILKDEEWEHVESGETVTIDSVDTKRNLVIVVGKAHEKRRSVPMLDFVSAKWRKIIRRTAFARILEDD